MRELIWMSKILRNGREQVTIDDEAAEVPAPVPYPACGAEMTHHADKAMNEPADASGVALVAAIHACADCGGNQTAAIGPAQADLQPA